MAKTLTGDEDPRPGALAQADATRNHSSSLRRALGLLDQLAQDGESGGKSLADLGREVGLNPSTVLRLLSPMAEHGLVHQEPASRAWRLGPHLAYLGQRYLDGIDLRQVANATLSRLTAASAESSHLVIFDSPSVVYLDKVESPSKVRMVSRVGTRQPAYSTAVGKAYLAWADESDVEAVIANGLEPRTANTLTTEPEFREALASIRESGYSVDDIENEHGIRCVGASIFDHAGKVCAAISIAGPAARVTRRSVPRLARLVIYAAEEITELLGGRPRHEPSEGGEEDPAMHETGREPQ